MSRLHTKRCCGKVKCCRSMPLKTVRFAHKFQHRPNSQASGRVPPTVACQAKATVSSGKWAQLRLAIEANAPARRASCRLSKDRTGDKSYSRRAQPSNPNPYALAHGSQTRVRSTRASAKRAACVRGTLHIRCQSFGGLWSDVLLLLPLSLAMVQLPNRRLLRSPALGKAKRPKEARGLSLECSWGTNPKG